MALLWMFTKRFAHCCVEHTDVASVSGQFDGRASFHRITLLATLCAFVSFLPGPVFADSDRIALVVGNGAYQHMPPLPNPTADAKAVAEVLSKLGYENGHVEPLLNADLRTFVKAVRAFGDRLRGARIGVIYYSGHGMQLDEAGSTESYLMPVDAELSDIRDAKRQALALNELLGDSEHQQAAVVALLDACRDNPTVSRMTGTGTRSVPRSGLIPIAQSSLPAGTLVSYATSAGQVADDGNGRNSPYAKALIKYLPTPDFDVTRILRQVRNEVIQSTNGKQRPEMVDNLNDELFLMPAHEAPAPAVSAPVADPLAAETALWAAVHDSKQQTDFEIYLRRFPQGLYADLARNRIESLTRESQQAMVTPLSVQTPAVKPSLAIKGVVGTYSGDGWPIIGDRIIRLTGVEAVPQERMKKFVTWLTNQRAYLECEVKAGDGYRCWTSQSEDLGQALLLNGQAHASASADQAYVAAEQQARMARKGIWK